MRPPTFFQKLTEHTLGVCMLLLVLTSFYLLKSQRYDVIACCLILFNMVYPVFQQVHHQNGVYKRINNHKNKTSEQWLSEGWLVETDKTINTLHEPDELIEMFQEGYVIGLKNLLSRQCEYFIHSVGSVHEVQRQITVINQMNIVTEMELRFYLCEPDVSHNIHWIYIIDEKTKKQWEQKPFSNDKIDT